MKNGISNPFSKLEEEIGKLKLKETPAHFIENIYVTRNIIAIRQSYLLKECGWSESQIEQILDPEQVEPGKKLIVNIS